MTEAGELVSMGVFKTVLASMVRESGGHGYQRSVSSTAQVQRWILGFGALVKVISPVEMVTQIRAVGGAIADLYTPTETPIP